MRLLLNWKIPLRLMNAYVVGACISSQAWKAIRKLNSICFEHRKKDEKWRKPLNYLKKNHIINSPVHRFRRGLKKLKFNSSFRVLNSFCVLVNHFLLRIVVKYRNAKRETKTYKSAYIFFPSLLVFRQMTADNHEWEENFLRWLN